MIQDNEGTVTVFLDVAYDEKSTELGWYDHDNSEEGGIGEDQPLAKLFKGFSYGKSWAPQAIAAAEKMGRTHGRSLFLLFDTIAARKLGRINKRRS